jgi:hypothetical protein
MSFQAGSQIYRSSKPQTIIIIIIIIIVRPVVIVIVADVLFGASHFHMVQSDSRPNKLAGCLCAFTHTG